MGCKMPPAVLLQVVLNVCIFISSMATCLSLGWVSIGFFDGCILYANMPLSKTSNGSLTIDATKTTWGPETTCYYCIYLPVFSSILTLMWLWFFILGRKAGDRILEKETEKSRRPEDWFLLVPALPIGSIMSVCCFVASVMITGGFRAWCNGATKSNEFQCSDTAVFEWVGNENGKMAYPYLQTAMLSSWFLTVTTISFTVLAAYRCWLFIKDPLDSEEGRNDEEYDGLAPSTGIPNPSYEDIGATGADSTRISDDEGLDKKDRMKRKLKKPMPV